MSVKHNISQRQPGNADRLQKASPSEFPLGRKNFIYIIASGIMIVLGFLLMLGGSSTEEAFNPDIFSARRIVVGPTLAFLGFVAMGVSIIISPRDKSHNPSAEDIEETI